MAFTPKTPQARICQKIMVPRLEGFVKQQAAAGTWAGGQSSDGGLYSPKWISTT
jgi:hypothetical protein